MPVVGQPYQPDNSNVIGDLLTLLSQGGANMVQAKIQSGKDAAYRRSAAKLMGVDEADLGHFQREELKDLIKEKKKADWGEWKPKTKEEAIEVAAAKKGASKIYEEDIKSAIANGQPLNKEQTNYFNKFLKKPMDPEIIYAEPKNDSLDDNKKPDTAGSGGIGQTLMKLLSGIGQAAASPVTGFTNMIRPQGAVTSPVPTEVAKEIPQPGAAAPVAAPEIAPETKSPYPDYPDAFLEGGVWKVIREGKKYKIQE